MTLFLYILFFSYQKIRLTIKPQVFKNFSSGSLRKVKNFCQLAFERKYSLVLEYFLETYFKTIIRLVCCAIYIILLLDFCNCYLSCRYPVDTYLIVVDNTEIKLYQFAYVSLHISSKIRSSYRRC